LPEPDFTKDYGDYEDEETFAVCCNCSAEISRGEYDRTGTDEYCEDCPEMCCDPRSKAFGCECEEEGD
jgi:hypothetical protein